MDQALANLSCTPGGVLALHVQDVVLDLKRQLVRIVMGAPTSVGQPLNAAFLIAIEDLVARLTGDPELPAHPPFAHNHAADTLKRIRIYFCRTAQDHSRPAETAKDLNGPH